MIIEKLLWVCHPEEKKECIFSKQCDESDQISSSAIYSVDLHPDESRFATGGGDSAVRIWSTEGLCTSGANSNTAIDMQNLTREDSAWMRASMARQLKAVLSNHTSTVNCVRWSNEGRFLASCSADRLVFIWELRQSETASAPFGSSAPANKENWTRASTLRGHSMDVLDIAWSPDDCFLASCSIDNSVLVWIMGGPGKGHVPGFVLTPHCTLNHHTSWVKGVCWDPTGKYLASSGEDGSLAIWEKSKITQSDFRWILVKDVKEPFAQDGSATQTFFRRISWSPDGGYLCATNCVNQGLNTALLLKRGIWNPKESVNLVGTTSALLSSRFHPRLFVKSTSTTTTDSKDYFACGALGGNDASVSIWLTTHTRPIIVIRDCFKKAVTDLTWARSSNILLASSIDGSLSAFKFQEKELGMLIPTQHQHSYFDKTYGMRLKGWLAGNSQNHSENGNAFDEDELLVEDPRILAAQASKIQEKRTFSEMATSFPAPRPPNIEHTPAQTQQIETRDSKGKKRIRPILMTQQPSIQNTGENQMQQTLQQQATLVASPKPIVNVPPAATQFMENAFQLPPNAVQNKTAQAVLSSSIFNLTTPVVAAANQKDLLAVKIPQKDGRSSICFEVAYVSNQNTPTAQTPSLSRLMMSQSGQLRWEAVFPTKASAICGSSKFVAIGSVEGTLHLWQTSTGIQFCPQIVVGDPIAFLSCIDESQPAEFSDFSDEVYLVAITVHGWVRVWDLRQMKMVVREDLAPVLFTMRAASSTLPLLGGESEGDVGIQIVECHVRQNGSPAVVMELTVPASQITDRQAFLFDRDMGSWLRIDDMMHSCSVFFPPAPLASSGKSSDYFLSHIQAQCRPRRRPASSFLKDAGPLSTEVTLSHIQDQLSAALTVNSVPDFQRWIGIYSKHLANQQDERGARLLCERLLSDSKQQARSQDITSEDELRAMEIRKAASLISWWASIDESLCIDKDLIDARKLLEEIVLPAIATNPSFQRLFLEYKDNITMLQLC